jgi:hypothetical protein
MHLFIYRNFHEGEGGDFKTLSINRLREKKLKVYSNDKKKREIYDVYCYLTYAV